MTLPHLQNIRCDAGKGRACRLAELEAAWECAEREFDVAVMRALDALQGREPGIRGEIVDVVIRKQDARNALNAFVAEILRRAIALCGTPGTWASTTTHFKEVNLTLMYPHVFQRRINSLPLI